MGTGDWRLIGCVALRLGLHEGDGEFDFLTVKKVGDTPLDVMSHLTVQLAEQGDRFIHQPVVLHLIEPVEDHLPAERKPLHHRRIFPQQLLRVVHLWVVITHVDFLPSSCNPRGAAPHSWDMECCRETGFVRRRYQHLRITENEVETRISSHTSPYRLTPVCER